MADFSSTSMKGGKPLTNLSKTGRATYTAKKSLSEIYKAKQRRYQLFHSEPRQHP